MQDKNPRSHVASFPPQVAEGCRLLLLGTAPSVRSLALQQSYAHPQNLFWPLMGEMFDAGPELAYAQRVRRLHARGIGIWDVLQYCERPGSLDSSIVRSSEVPNDIPGLLEIHPGIAAIALNGGRAQQSFHRHVLPALDGHQAERIVLLDLPSTSPANAGMTRAEKCQRWKVLLDWAG